MIIPDEDTKDASGSHSSPRVAVSTCLAYEIANEAGSSRVVVPGPVNEESEADLADPLPPYTPRETDPLLGNHWSNRKKKRRRRICSNVSGLLLVGAFTGLLTYNIIDGWRSHRDRVGAGELCRPASTWTFHNSTESDLSLYVETDVILPLGLETLAIVSGCRECKSRIKLKASSTYRGENVRLNIRAGHREMTMLREMSVCHQFLSNMNITSFIRGPRLPLGYREPVSLDIVLDLPNSGLIDGPTRFIPDLEVVSIQEADISAGDLMSGVHFGRLALGTADGNIHVGRVQAEKIGLTTGRGVVDAEIHSSVMAEIVSLSSPVRANITMYRTAPHTLPVEVSVRTSGDTDVNITLVDGVDIETNRPELKVVGYTTAEDLKMRILDAPLGTVIMAHAHAERSSALLALPKSFEGAFIVRSQQDTQIDVREDDGDPWGKNMTRWQSQERLDSSNIFGRTGWKAKEEASCGENLCRNTGHDRDWDTPMVFVHADHGTARLVVS